MFSTGNSAHLSYSPKSRTRCKSIQCDCSKQKCGFALAIERVCTIPVLVEKLCKVCERRCKSSHTFRLPSTSQSETIPRCLTAAVRGPQPRNEPRAERQGHVGRSGAGV